MFSFLIDSIQAVGNILAGAIIGVGLLLSSEPLEVVKNDPELPSLDLSKGLVEKNAISEEEQKKLDRALEDEKRALEELNKRLGVVPEVTGDEEATEEEVIEEELVSDVVDSYTTPYSSPYSSPYATPYATPAAVVPEPEDNGLPEGLFRLPNGTVVNAQGHIMSDAEIATYTNTNPAPIPGSTNTNCTTGPATLPPGVFQLPNGKYMDKGGNFIDYNPGSTSTNCDTITTTNTNTNTGTQLFTLPSGAIVDAAGNIIGD